MATRNGLGELAFHAHVEQADQAVDLGAGEQRRAAGGVEARGRTEDGEHAVAGAVVHPAAVAVDGLADRVEEIVEQIDHVVGQLLLGQRGEAAHVDEQHGELALDAAGFVVVMDEDRNVGAGARGAPAA